MVINFKSVVLIFLLCTCCLYAENEVIEVTDPETVDAPQVKAPQKAKRKYITDVPDRTDAGVFYAAAVVGGNFYTEPEFSVDTNLPSGNSFKDIGFAGGAYFDYDYSALDQNIPLALRGFVGYKYILKSVHVFAFEFIARRMILLSEKVTFGIGIGTSAALWYRPITADNEVESWSFVPSFIIESGFEFNPFMIDFKALINRIADNNTVLGLEMYFGFRF